MNINFIGKKTDFGLKFVEKINLENKFLFGLNVSPDIYVINLEENISLKEKKI